MFFSNKHSADTGVKYMHLSLNSGILATKRSAKEKSRMMNGSTTCSSLADGSNEKSFAAKAQRLFSNDIQDLYSQMIPPEASPL